MKPPMKELREAMFLQQYLRNAKNNNQIIYANFLEKRLNGETLSFTTINKEELHALYIKENLVDKQIAFLFEVEPEIVQSKRLSWNIVRDRFSIAV